MSKDLLNQAEDNRTEVVFCVKFNRKIFADQRLKDFLKLSENLEKLQKESISLSKKWKFLAIMLG